MMDARATYQRMHTEQSRKKLEEAAEKYHRVMARLGELVPRKASEAVKEASQAKIKPPLRQTSKSTSSVLQKEVKVDEELRE